MNKEIIEILNGKSQSDFESFFRRIKGLDRSESDKKIFERYLSADFYTLEIIFRYSIYEDFFELNNIRIILHYCTDDLGWYCWVNNWLSPTFKNRDDARLVALEKATEIYNSEL